MNPATNSNGKRPASQRSTVKLCIRSEDGLTGCYEIKHHLKLARLFSLFCEKKDLDYNVVVFLHEGKPLQPSLTPEELGLQDGDVINAMTRPTDEINLRIISQDGNEMYFPVKYDKKLGSVFRNYCVARNLDYKVITFLLNGQRVRPSQTPNELRLRSGDEIQAMSHQSGGGHWSLGNLND